MYNSHRLVRYSVLAFALCAVPAAIPSRVVLVVGEGLNEPFGVDFDVAGNAYIVEMSGNRVSVLDTSGKLNVLAGTGEKGLAGDGGPAARAQFNGPHHLLVGPDGALYVADTWNNCVRKIDLGSGIVTRVAGTGEKGMSGDGGPALQARFGGSLRTCRELRAEPPARGAGPSRNRRDLHLGQRQPPGDPNR